MSLSPLDIAVYVGLVGVIIALFVATAQNKWQPRVFALLALRLAIGWHFCFEGMHKIRLALGRRDGHDKPFTSANYFNVGTGPLADYMKREYISDPVKIAALTSRQEEGNQSIRLLQTVRGRTGRFVSRSGCPTAGRIGSVPASRS